MVLPPTSLDAMEREMLGQLNSAAASADPAQGERAVRRLLALTDIRETIVHPACVSWANPEHVDDAAADMDILKLLAAEVMTLPQDGLMRKAWLRAAFRLLDSRIGAERSGDGLWADAPQDMAALDLRIQEYLPQALRRAEMTDDAWPPLGMESQRPFQPPREAIRWG